MNIPFSKYHGAGNDFILIDNRELKLSLSQPTIELLCNRHLGIGADGLMLLNEQSGYDFSMVYYNADGFEGTMCGNGGRCIVAFAHALGVIKDQAHFIAVDGVHSADVKQTHGNITQIKLQMNDVNAIQKYHEDYILNTGSPHYVRFVSDTLNTDVFEIGRAIRYDKGVSEKGVNVNFVQAHDDFIFVRTYERGVEDETLSCGTGSIASAIAYALHNGLKVSQVQVKTKGGNLIIYFSRNENSFSNIWLEGPATLVFKGHVSV